MGSRGDDGDTPNATSLHTVPASDVERSTRRVLVVLGPSVQTSYALGPSGRVSIGRSSDILVAVDDPEISRHHVVLHLGPTLRVEDLGSSNGTSIGRRKLANKEIAA